ncbi:MAG: hypothetical protein ACI4AO_06975, partial [Anaerotignum sp.]
ERGSQAFCYFLCAKSKEDFCSFANTVPNGRAEGLPDLLFGSNEPSFIFLSLRELKFQAKAITSPS